MYTHVMTWHIHDGFRGGICVLMAQAELAEIGSHSMRKRQMIFFMGKR